MLILAAGGMIPYLSSVPPKGLMGSRGGRTKSKGVNGWACGDPGGRGVGLQGPRGLRAGPTGPQAPCLFLAIIKGRYEEDFGYQYMCNFPLFTSQIQRHLNDQFSSASRQRRN